MFTLSVVGYVFEPVVLSMFTLSVVGYVFCSICRFYQLFLYLFVCLFLISELKKKRKGKVNSSTIQEIDRLSDRILVLEKELVDKTVALQQFEVQLYLQILYW
jgi:hypothetical protein